MKVAAVTAALETLKVDDAVGLAEVPIVILSVVVVPETFSPAANSTAPVTVVVFVTLKLLALIFRMSAAPVKTLFDNTVRFPVKSTRPVPFKLAVIMRSLRKLEFPDMINR